MKRKKLATTTGAQEGSQLTAAQYRALKKSVDSTPLAVATASTTQTNIRRDIAGSIPRTNRFTNIEEGLVPFKYSSTTYGTNNRSAYDVRDAVVLCQKAYYNFAIFRNIIDLMTEFSVGKIILKGGSAQSRSFYNALFHKLNFWDFQDKFYREYYRSGNLFIYRFDADVEQADVRRLSAMFSEESKAKEDPKNYTYLAPNLININPDKLQIPSMKIPARYIMLNPADIQMMSTLNFAYGIYFKIMTDYEIAKLRNPTTPEDVEVFNDLPKKVQEQIKTGSRVIAIPLDPQKISMVFYKKQDYEPFSVPMGYPVLEDINAKAEMRKIDMAIARTMQQIILLVTCGDEPTKGGVNQRNITALQTLLQNQSVGRVLVADYTTEAKFVIPAIGDLLDPKKYEVINEDINIGLNNVFAGSDKFANQQQKVELFVTRLEQGRQAFLNTFLIPEMRRIAKSLNFKNIPMPEYDAIELKDSTTSNKIIARLIEVGVLTPEQGFKALDTGVFPDPERMEEEQEAYKKQRDEGLYTPLVGGAKGQGGDVGRPDGATAPQTVKTIKPIGTKASTDISDDTVKYSIVKVKDNMVIAQELQTLVNETLKEKHKIKRMSKLQKTVAEDIAAQIMANEEPSKWLSVAKAFCDNPVDTNPERVLEVNKIACAHQVDNYLASLLLASKLEDVKPV